MGFLAAQTFRHSVVWFTRPSEEIGRQETINYPIRRLLDGEKCPSETITRQEPVDHQHNRSLDGQVAPTTPSATSRTDPSRDPARDPLARRHNGYKQPIKGYFDGFTGSVENREGVRNRVSPPGTNDRTLPCHVQLRPATANEIKERYV